ncbi:uncharacterized protein METZ01_LOCUS112742 [marine metagenome]|uniref:Uncharacterized protein n=1 Tax=marine metagenome TaxID=408172 RepID=A0A381X5E9_9ZZZZ
MQHIEPNGVLAFSNVHGTKPRLYQLAPPSVSIVETVNREFSAN